MMFFSTMLRTLGIFLLFFPSGHKSFRQFFGMIGPNLRIKNIKNLFDLFTGDGVIQSMFFENTTASPQFHRHIIETSVYRLRSRGPTPQWLLHYAMHKMRMMSINNGVANTALLPVPLLSNASATSAYALFERDMPYLVEIDHDNRSIKTVGPVKTSSQGLLTMSGHTKRYNTTHLETIDYHMFSKKVVYHLVEERLLGSSSIQLVSQQSIPVKTRYLPVVHDFATTDRSIIITDSPLVFDFWQLFRNRLPVVFNKTAPTEIHVLNKTTGHVKRYFHPSSFYIFHYADAHENDTHIMILAPVYDDLDFSSISIYGRYRKIMIDKRNGAIKIIKNPDLEQLNLDFPISMGNGLFIFRSIKDHIMNGFVVVDHNLTIRKIITIPNTYALCGEPGYMKMTDGSSKIVAFLYDKNEWGYYYSVDPENGIETMFPLHTMMTPGFHSMTFSGPNINDSPQ